MPSIDEIDQKYTARRREEMRLRPVRYGFFRVVKDSNPIILCESCKKEINGQRLVINGKTYHYESCFPKEE